MLSALGEPPRRALLKAALLLGIWVAAAVAPVAWLAESQAAEAFPAAPLPGAAVGHRASARGRWQGSRLAVYAGRRLEDGAFENVTVLSDRDVLSGRLGRLTGQGLRLELTLQRAEVWRHTGGLRRRR